jgi:HD-GYP domain-containing protein (c-di-GMP phosphodiesterase class II)
MSYNTREIAANVFSVRLRSIPPNVPLSFALYMYVDGSPLLFRVPGDTLTSQRVKALAKHNIPSLLILKKEKQKYQDFMWGEISDSRVSEENRQMMLRGVSFVQIEDLFTSNDLALTFTEISNWMRKATQFATGDLKFVSEIIRKMSHDEYGYKHAVDVAAFATALIKKIYVIAPELSVPEFSYEGGLAGMVHDIGERKLDPKILKKGEFLSPNEREELEKHPIFGFEIARKLQGIPPAVLKAVVEHHEDYGGSGYPRRIAGTELSFLAKVVSICDVYDALTSHRPYRGPLQPAEALTFMRNMQPGKFDPDLLEVFIQQLE